MILNFITKLDLTIWLFLICNFSIWIYAYFIEKLITKEYIELKNELEN